MIATVVTSVKKKLLIKLKQQPKFRIIISNNKYLSQEFHGYWKIGFYLNFTYHTSPPWLPYSFEHSSLGEAELAIEKRMKEFHGKTYIIKEYL
jgi:hypothetical protein